MKKISTYHDDLMMRLKNPVYAVGFLNVCLEDDDKRVFLMGLRDVAEAQGGITKLSRTTKITREHIHRMLSQSGNPEFYTLQTLLDAFGFRMAIQAKNKPRYKRPRRKAA